MPLATHEEGDFTDRFSLSAEDPTITERLPQGSVDRLYSQPLHVPWIPSSHNANPPSSAAEMGPTLIRLTRRKATTAELQAHAPLEDAENNGGLGQNRSQ
jgi:hypothetical protein